MKITFVVPALNLTGGLRVVSIYAELLAKKGHKVTVVSPNQNTPSIKERIKSVIGWKGYKFQPWFNRTFFENISYEVIVLDKHRKIESEDVPQADIIIATFWNTAEWISDFPSSKGKKVYFIQHYEVHPWLPLERVQATFSLPYKKIVVAQWIADSLRVNHKVENVTVVPNGVDTNQFFSPERSKQEITTFGIMYSPRTYKGCHIAFSAFEKARAENNLLKLIAFGTTEPMAELPLPEGTEFYLLPKQSQLKNIYGSCDAWLFSSETEGFGLPILEAMACRTPVIGTDCGAASMLINESNGFLIDVNDTESMLKAMTAIIKMDDSDWQKCSRSAFLTAEKHKWNDTVALFEKALIKSHEGEV